MSNYKGPYNSLSQNAEPIYNQSNILGTVSQSDGVPTGAIIERGSNSDGYYVKFADGTIVCRLGACLVDVTTGDVQTFISPHGSTQANVHFRYASTDPNTLIWFANIRSIVVGSTGNVLFRISTTGSATGVDATRSIVPTVIGRWY